MHKAMAVCCVILLATCIQTLLGANQLVTKRTDLGLGRETGYALEEFPDGSCILFRLFFISDDFFSDIKRTDASTGAIFRKAGKTVESFPEHMVLNVEANLYACGDKPINRRPPLGFKSDLMKSLSFRLQWKKEFNLTPIEIESMQSQAPVVYLFSNRWDYFMKFSAKSIPLSDSLIIDVLTKDNSVIRRLSARL